MDVSMDPEEHIPLENLCPPELLNSIPESPDDWFALPNVWDDVPTPDHDLPEMSAEEKAAAQEDFERNMREFLAEP